MERDLGPQPVGEILQRHDVVAKDVVAASREQITFKMVQRAIKGRRLTEHVMAKIVRAVNAATGEAYTASQLFTYASPRREGSRGPGSPGQGSWGEAPSC